MLIEKDDDEEEINIIESATVDKQGSIENHQEQSIHTCNICDSRFNTRRNLESHQMNKHSKQKTSVHPCEQCESVFSSTQHLNRHERKVHIQTVQNKDVILNCYSCGEIFQTKSALISHKNECIEKTFERQKIKEWYIPPTRARESLGLPSLRDFPREKP